MTKPFELSIIKENGSKQIDFANYSQSFVEVVFTIDNKEVKNGTYYSPSVKGYCYPPSHHKPIRTMANGKQLPFANSGTLRAYVYTGVGELIEEDYDVPPFIRYKLNEQRFRNNKANMHNFMSQNKKANFKRIGISPIEVLEIPY
jgi:hypothetical protein